MTGVLPFDPAVFAKTVRENAQDNEHTPEGLMPTPPVSPSIVAESQRPATGQPTPPQPPVSASAGSAYRAFQERSGCNLVFCEQTQRHVLVLPGAVPKPKGFTLGSQLYRKRQAQADSTTSETQNLENFLSSLSNP